jgi:hypothetical protein
MFCFFTSRYDLPASNLGIIKWARIRAVTDNFRLANIDDRQVAGFTSQSNNQRQNAALYDWT